MKRSMNRKGAGSAAKGAAAALVSAALVVSLSPASAFAAETTSSSSSSLSSEEIAAIMALLSSSSTSSTSSDSSTTSSLTAMASSGSLSVSDVAEALGDVEIDISGATVKLGRKTLTYTGKAQKPEVTLKVAGIPLPSSLYSVTYKNNKKIGTGKVVVKGKSPLSGSITKKFTIKPADVKVKKATAGKNKIKVRLAGKKGGTTYQVYYKAKTASKWRKTTTKASSVTLKKLGSGKKYLVKVRAYKKSGGKTYYGDWTKSKAVRAK